LAEPRALSPSEIIALLGLEPHPGEGGLYAETWRSGETIAAEALPGRYDAARSLGTAIYYLLTPDTFSSMHRLRSDEIFHFYLGDPVEMLVIPPGGDGSTFTLSPRLAAGHRPQLLVPRGSWQGSRLVPGGRVALLGTTVAPGYDPADFESGNRAELIERYPGHAALIRALTREP
jgi:predicted cupin superfamily sugar epimerase